MNKEIENFLCQCEIGQTDEVSRKNFFPWTITEKPKTPVKRINIL